ncbi:hypothetical protein E8E12_001413 [Didymella heteroderae]|uniref:Uncharacterized protein n=1 Tax=Didymella heteroderae TaxID=1769908 RepID=A0A9P4WGN1_9PLEO|nr:hypothetical protein E8E12_001413 [Didymella heteroderae]
MANLTEALFRQGDNKEADVMGTAVLKMRQNVLGPDHFETMASAYSLAQVFAVQKRYSESERL